MHTTTLTTQIIKGDVLLVDFGQNNNNGELYGTWPCIVIQNNKNNRFSPTLIVVPIRTNNTSLVLSKADLSGFYEMKDYFKGGTPCVDIKYIKTVAKERCIAKVGYVRSSFVELIDQALILLLTFEQQTKKFKRGDIWYIDLDGGIGREQQKVRPCIILQVLEQDKEDLLIVVPIASKERSLPTHATVRSEDIVSGGLITGTALTEQIRFVSTARIHDHRKECDLTEAKQADVLQRLKVTLAIKN